MSYGKPKCECGRDLFYVKTVVTEKLFIVKNNGKHRQNPIESNESMIEQESLYCTECQETYAVQYDERERLVRSDLIS